MEIQFQATGSTAGFETWLNGFKEISDSLLIEIDTDKQQFVAKVFSVGRDIVKYGKIDFSAAGYEVTYVKDAEQKKITLEEWNAANVGAKRIYFPIFQQIKNFISVISFFKGSENYKMTVKFTEKDDCLLAVKAELKSISATMNVRSSELTEFKDIIELLSDDKFFNHVSAIPNPMSFTVEPDTWKSLISMSNIYSNDPKKDILSFQTKKDGDGWLLCAVDQTGATYDFKLAYMNQDCENPVETSLPVIRGILISAIKNDSEASVITVDGVEGGSGKKVRIESGTMFTTMIASVVTG